MPSGWSTTITALAGRRRLGTDRMLRGMTAGPYGFALPLFMIQAIKANLTRPALPLVHPAGADPPTSLVDHSREECCSMSLPTKKKSGTAKSKWAKLYWAVPAALVALLLVVLLAKWITGLAGVKDFLAAYPGHSELPRELPRASRPGWRGNTSSTASSCCSSSAPAGRCGRRLVRLPTGQGTTRA